MRHAQRSGRTQDLAQHPRRRVAIQPQLSLIHRYLRLVRISLS
jgi:hypothetical protein